MEHLNRYVLINGWQINGGNNSTFVFYGEIVDGISSNNDGDIHVRYHVDLYDDSDRRLEQIRNRRAEDVEDFELLDSEPDESMLDKERPARQGYCPQCRTYDVEFRLVFGRSLRFPRNNVEIPGDWQCLRCSYTYYDNDIAEIPDWLRDELRTDRRRDNLSELEEEWVQENERRIMD